MQVLRVYAISTTNALLFGNVRSDITVYELKQRLQEANGLPPKEQFLVYNRQTLQDDKTLEESNLEDECILDLLLPEEHRLLYPGVFQPDVYPNAAED